MKRGEVWPKLTLEQWEADAINWGGALNDAAWTFIQAWNEAWPDKSMPAVLFNNLKHFLRPAIRRYALEVAKAAVEREEKR